MTNNPNDRPPFSGGPKHWVLIPAAGIGARMQADKPKQYLTLSSQTVLEHTLQIFLNDNRFHHVLVGLAHSDPYYSALPSVSDHDRLTTFVGGEERSDTVRLGLEAISSRANADDWVWVHDAARPCLSRSDIDSIFQKLSDNASSVPNSAYLNGALLAAPLHDTIKYSGNNDNVDHTVSREGLWRALTPQVFRFEQLVEALDYCEQNALKVTDESSAIEAIGKRPLLVEGSSDNIKITRPSDLRFAQMIMLQKNNSASC